MTSRAGAGESTVWDRLARRYDVAIRLFDRSYPEVRARIARDLSGSERLLEIAAGTGQFTCELAAAAGALVATDISEQMVERLRDRLRERGLSRVDVRAMSACALAFEDETFDAVFCANALHVMERPGSALNEMARVLRPGGRLLAPTFCHGASVRVRVVSRLLSLVSPFVAHTRFTPESLAALVAQHGFEIRALDVLPGLIPMAYLAARRAAGSA